LFDEFFLVGIPVGDTGEVEYGLEVLDVTEDVRH